MRRNLNASMQPGPYREEHLNGRDYVVVPMTLIVPGVLDGSNGPLLYEEEEVAREPDIWNGIPLIAYHPETTNDDGEVQAVSARDPEVLKKSQVGYNYRTEYRDGALRSEGWFDKELTANYDTTLPEQDRMLPRLLNGQPIELSTGLYAENIPAKGTHNGIAYHYIARNYKTDHIAILPNQKGACSVRDGCGTGVTENTHPVYNCKYNYKGTCIRCGQVRNSNPEGCNQYTGKHCSPSMARESDRIRKFVTEMGLDPNKLNGDDLAKAVKEYGKKDFVHYTPDKFLEVLARKAPEEAKTPLAPPIPMMPVDHMSWGKFVKGYTEDEMKDMADKLIAHVGEESFTTQVDWQSQNYQGLKKTGLEKRPEALRARAAFETFVGDAAHAAGMSLKEQTFGHFETGAGASSGSLVSGSMAADAWARAWNIAKGTLLNNRTRCTLNCYGICLNCGGKGGKPGPCPKGTDKGSSKGSAKSSTKPKTAQSKTPTKQKAFRNPAEANKASEAAHKAATAANIRYPVRPDSSTYGAMGQVPHEEAHTSYVKKQKDAAEAHEKAEKEHRKLASIRSPTSSRHASIAEHHKTMAEHYKKRATSTRNKSNHNKGYTMKEQLTRWLITNCDCWKDKEKILNTLTEEELKELKGQFVSRRIVNAAAAKFKGAFTTNAEGEGEVAGIDYGTLAEVFQIDVDITKDPVGFIKALKGKLQEVMDSLDHNEPEPAPAEPVAAMNDDDTPALNAMDDVGPAKDPTMTSNKNGKGKMTPAQFKEMMPEEYRDAWNDFVSNSRNERVTLLNHITNGATPAEKKELLEAYKNMPLPKLRIVAKRMGVTTPTNNKGGYLPEDNLPVFNVGSGYNPNNNGGGQFDENDIFEVPVENFSRKDRFKPQKPNHLTDDDGDEE